MSNEQLADTNDVDHFVIGSLVRYIVKTAIDAGIPTERLMAASGFDADILFGSQAKLPSHYLEKLIVSAANISADPLLGLHLSAQASQEGFGVLGYIRQACSSLREVIDMTIRYESLVSSIGKTSLRHEPGALLWCFQLHMQLEAAQTQGMDYMLGCWRNTLLRLLPAPEPVLLRVDFTHAAPNPIIACEYEKLFGCPVRFNQTVSALVLPSVVLDWPLSHPDIGLQQLLEQHAKQLLHTEQPAFAEQVQMQLAALLRLGQASRNKLAAALRMSGRHLSRRLQAHGMSYRQLLNEQRLQLLQQYLLEEKQSVANTAKRLGFSESQSFARWLQQHSGMTPGEYRKQARQTKSGELTRQ